MAIFPPYTYVVPQPGTPGAFADPASGKLDVFAGVSSSSGGSAGNAGNAAWVGGYVSVPRNAKGLTLFARLELTFHCTASAPFYSYAQSSVLVGAELRNLGIQRIDDHQLVSVGRVEARGGTNSAGFPRLFVATAKVAWEPAPAPEYYLAAVGVSAQVSAAVGGQAYARIATRVMRIDVEPIL
jgi:hypothetical protein